MTDPCAQYETDGSLCIPIYWKQPPSPVKREQMRKAVTSIRRIDQHNLNMIQAFNVDIQHVINVKKVIDKANQILTGQTGGVVTALAYARDMAERGNDRITRVAEKFAEQMDRLNRKQFELLGASKNSQKVVREELRQEYMKAVQILNKEAKFAGMISPETKAYFASANKIERMARRKGIFVESLADVKQVANIARYGRIINHTFLAFGLVQVGMSTTEAYLKGGIIDAVNTGVSDLAAFGLFVVVGNIMLRLTPEGWIVTLIVSAIEGAAYHYGNDKLSDAMNQFLQWSERYAQIHYKQ